MSDLVIVESPHKAKTIKKYLGSGYEVVASNGHIRDLPKTKLGVDVEDNFTPVYVSTKKQDEVIKNLKKYAEKADKIYLAGDPDREGEAISWHLAYLLNLPLTDKNRVTFNEITKTGIAAGMEHPRSIDMNLVNAQQARRILDRIVGYKLSPFLWKKVRRGLSAGRVQSVAVRLIVDRENEIKSFIPEEYYTIDVMLRKKDAKKAFAAKFYGRDGKKQDIKTREQADEILELVNDADFVVSSVKKGVRKKNSAPPFTTSTMQQEASRKLGFITRRTMKAAQELYEGVDVEGMGAVGLITYMRTDSLRVSNEAREAAYEYIKSTYGDKYVPKSPKVYKSKSNAQDAHEAIRPTVPDLTPEKVKSSLTTDQYKLYKLVWERFIASQMENAQLDTVSAEITANGCVFKASGYSVRFDGFTVLYEEGKDEAVEKEGKLPVLSEGEILVPDSISGNQHFTQPPARYTEASFVKAMEENGIGRPSTYTATISTIIARSYVEREAKQLKSTALGEVTTDLMKERFPDIVDVDFTARMETDLDRIESGEKDWIKTLDNFYQGFEKTLAVAEKEMEGSRVKVPDEETDIVCEQCGRKMVIKIGRFGKFLACPGFPECRNTKKIVQETPGVCPLCGKKILEKKSKKGKKYYGCEDNPTCGFMSWDEPIEEKCPKCGKTLLKKKGKTGRIYCSDEQCGYERGLDD